MATVVTGQRSSYQDRSTVKDNIDNRLDFLTPLDTPFMSYIGFMRDAGGAFSGANSLKFPCTQTRHTWFNDELVPSVSTVGTAYTSGAGILVVESGTGEYFDVDDVIMVGTMHAIVTQVTDDTLTISELDSTGANASVGDEIQILMNARSEGTSASAITPRTTDFGSTENFTQIFMGKVDITGTEQSTERWGINEDPYDFQVNKQLKQLAIKMERSLLYNIRNTSYPSTNATKRRMGGLAYFVRDAAGANSDDAGGADLDEVLLNDHLQTIWADGGMPDTIMINMRQKRMLSGFLQPLVRVDRSESIYGTIVGRYVSDMGEFDVVVNRWMRESDLIVLQREFIGVGPLNGNGNSRAFFTEPLPKTGDGDSTQMIGEYTMEVRNALKAFGWIRNLSVGS